MAKRFRKTIIFPDYTQHELSALFPSLPDGSEEFRALVDDIRDNGLKQPIVLYEGKVLDGWHRYRACEVLFKEDPTKCYLYADPEEPREKEELYVGFDVDKARLDRAAGRPSDRASLALAFVLSQNIKRRQLDKGQRAMVAAKMVTTTEGRPKNSVFNTLFSIDDAADMFGVSIDYVKQARAVLAFEDGELIDAVLVGEKTLSAAVKEVREIKRQREEAEEAQAAAEAAAAEAAQAAADASAEADADAAVSADAAEDVGDEKEDESVEEAVVDGDEKAAEEAAVDEESASESDAATADAGAATVDDQAASAEDGGAATVDGGAATVDGGAATAEDEQAESATESDAENQYNVVVAHPPWPAVGVVPDRVTLESIRGRLLDEVGLLEKLADDSWFFLRSTDASLGAAEGLVDELGLQRRFRLVRHLELGSRPAAGGPKYNCEFMIVAAKGSPEFVDTDFNVCSFSQTFDVFYETIRRATGGLRLDVFGEHDVDGFERWQAA